MISGDPSNSLTCLVIIALLSVIIVWPPKWTCNHGNFDIIIMVTVIIIFPLLVHYSPTTSILVEERPIVIVGQLSANCLRGKGPQETYAQPKSPQSPPCATSSSSSSPSSPPSSSSSLAYSSINSHYQKKRGTMLLRCISLSESNSSQQ